jgi:hypothetical protein
VTLIQSSNSVESHAVFFIETFSLDMLQTMRNVHVRCKFVKMVYIFANNSVASKMSYAEVKNVIKLKRKELAYMQDVKFLQTNKQNLRDFNPRAIYSDRPTADCR